MSPPFQGSGIPGPQGPQGPAGVGSQTLEEVLEQGEDAGNNSILNANNISANGNLTLKGEVLNPTKIVGSTTPAKCVVENCDLTDTSNVFPTNLTEGLGATLAAGTDGLGGAIANVASVSLQNTAVVISELSAGVGQIIVTGDSNVECGTLVATTEVDTGVCKASGSVQTPSLQVGPIGGTQLFTALENPAIAGSAIIGTSGAQSLIQSANIRATNQLQCFGAGAGILMDGANTVFEGESVPGDGKTSFSNCDFTSTTNTFPDFQSQELYDWGGFISSNTLVNIESDDEDWKDFGVDCFVLTKATTVAAHSRQMITLQVHNTRYAWGNIMLGLDIADYNGTNRTGLVGRTFITKVDGKGIQTADRQKIGVCQMTFFVDNMPTDGTQHRIYPKVKTDFEDSGRIIISYGPGIDHDENQASLVGNVLIRGEMCPPTWTVKTV